MNNKILRGVFLSPHNNSYFTFNSVYKKENYRKKSKKFSLYYDSKRKKYQRQRVSHNNIVLNRTTF